MIKKIILIGFGLGLCFLLEIMAHWILPENELNLLESIHTVCFEDNQLIWRQKKHLNTIFQDKNVVTNSLGLRNDEILRKKQPDLLRIICLGGSSTFGWGVDVKDTYPVYLQNLLNKRLSSNKVEVINAGQIGYTSYQGKLFLEKYLLDYNPDILTVSYVLNDIDKVRFFKNKKLSDSQVEISEKHINIVERYIIDKRIYFLAKRFVSFIIKKNKKIAASIIRNQYENSRIRVSAEEYRDNLNQITFFCKKKNIKLIFIVMPINLALPCSYSQEQGIFLSEEYYNKAKKFEQEKDYNNAELFYKKALDYQVFICRKNGNLFHEIMLRVAAENNIPVINAALVFKNYSQNNLMNLFNGPQDRIHPNPLGHGLIAEAIDECIKNENMLQIQ